MPFRTIPTIALSAVMLAFVMPCGAADDPQPLPLVIEDDFENGVEAWSPTDANKWKVSTDGTGHVYHLLGKSDFQPPHRSPHSISLRPEVVSDFELHAKVKTLQSSRAHRDMCVIFGYQDPAHFYYVHFGEKTDPHANQIFIVNGADRTKISEQTNSGTPWKDDTWHDIKIVRDVESGLIEIYFDDLMKPQMVAHDHTFEWGQIGLGSFDDLGQWDDLTLHGTRYQPNDN